MTGTCLWEATVFTLMKVWWEHCCLLKQFGVCCCFKRKLWWWRDLEHWLGYINSWLFLEKIWSPLDSFFQNGPPFGFCNNFLIIVKINSFNVKKGQINSFFLKKFPIVFFFFFSNFSYKTSYCFFKPSKHYLFMSCFTMK